MIDTLLNIWNLVLIVVGFGLVIVIHELGHFAAARWAGIRCHAFAVGFGPAIFSWRRGLGLRRGSSEPLYRRMLATAGGEPSALPAVSPTEYRLNCIPFGGYVKMLGQEDIDPSARSDAPDSYQSAKVWKRMIVISAGVIANIILAAALFMIVFAVGLREPAAIIGEVVPDSPADQAGLLPGDVVTAVNGQPMTFSDLRIAAAMSGKDESLSLTIDRQGKAITVAVAPEKKDGVPSIGIAPLTGLTVTDDVHRASARAQLASALAQIGLDGAAPGDTVVAADGVPLPEHVLPDAKTRSYRSLLDLIAAINATHGAPIQVTVQPAVGGDPFVRSLQPVIELQYAGVEVEDTKYGVGHVLGLIPIMSVGAASPQAEAQGLHAGDVFVRLGDVQWPGVRDGVAAIRAHRGRSIDATVLRDGQSIDLTLAVNTKGQIGFAPVAARQSNRIAQTPDQLIDSGWRYPALLKNVPVQRLLPALVPGSAIVAVNETTTHTFTDIVLALRDATSTQPSGADIALTVQLPNLAEGEAPAQEHRTWRLEAADVAALQALGWEIQGLDVSVLGFVEETIKASGPLEALAMGFHRTKRVILLTYLTFERLFQGQLAVDQLRGPVGIAHTGFYFAERGIIWVLFFLAMVSANLAVVNFLPLPIADGGQFLLLCWEGIRGKPAPVAVQNAIALAGLVLIVGLFLFITFHDVVRLLG
ncbi:MAG: site-2 protease family protein [Phycisphaerales bacterium]|nr:site-2 protease family protein [Phycisphaerales bacterium]